MQERRLETWLGRLEVFPYTAEQAGREGWAMQEARGGRRSHSDWSHLLLNTTGKEELHPHTDRHELELGELKQFMMLSRSVLRPAM